MNVSQQMQGGAAKASIRPRLTSVYAKSRRHNGHSRCRGARCRLQIMTMHLVNVDARVSYSVQHWCHMFSQISL
jgi:hypothetical protein